MSTHKYHFQYNKENHSKLSQICSYWNCSPVTLELVRNSRGKRVISVRATEVLLYKYNERQKETFTKLSQPSISRNVISESNLLFKNTLDSRYLEVEGTL